MSVATSYMWPEWDIGLETESSGREDPSMEFPGTSGVQWLREETGQAPGAPQAQGQGANEKGTVLERSNYGPHMLAVPGTQGP